MTTRNPKYTAMATDPGTSDDAGRTSGHDPGRGAIDLGALAGIDGDEMVQLATTEYDRLLTLLAGLDADEWQRPTACEDWDIRRMVAHLLGAAEANASMRENAAQLLRGRRRVRGTGRPLVDGINEVQVDDRDHLSPAELCEQLEAIAPKAIRGRYRTPGPMRRVKVPGPLGPIRLGHLVDVVYLRDQWMHRVDVVRATGGQLELTAEHDGRIVMDVAAEWARSHDQPVSLILTGPAGGRFTHRGGGPSLHLDAVDFCLALSGRERAEGLLAVEVVF